MPIAFIAIGILFLVAAVRGTLSTTTQNGNQVEGLIPLLESEFTGSDNFLIWMVAIFALGAVGYIPGFKPVSNAFLVLFVIVLFLTNGNPNSGSGGVFAELSSALKGTTTYANSATTSAAAAGANGISSGLPAISSLATSVPNITPLDFSSSSLAL